jgi:exosortase/archaeosortase family protein
MISLFLGEFFLFNWQRRILMIPIGFALAMILNLFRASLLTWIAAKKGVGAIAEYHDEAGLTILLVCTALLWGAAWLLNKRKNSDAEKTETTDNFNSPAGINLIQPRLNRLGLILIIWLVAVEGGVALWYHLRESHLTPGPDWSVNFPTNNPAYKEIPLTTEDHQLLRFDEGQKGHWHELDGTDWQAFYFYWRPGRVAGYLAKRHTPDICITASGLKMTAGPELTMLNVNGVDLPMRHYVFETADGPLQVYQCHWEAGLDKNSYTAEESGRFNLIRGIWAGRGNQGQKVLEIIISGYDDPALAKQALLRELNQMIAVKK